MLLTISALYAVTSESEVSAASLEFGVRDESVVDFKHDLMKLGFGTHWTNPTTYFGSDTEIVVRQLQEYYGLAVTGKGDQATLQKMNEVLSSPFQFGARSSEVQSLKEDLMRIGFGTHWTNPTTYFGSDTEKVVKEFQETNSLAVNGIADEVTLRKIEELLPQSHAPNVKLEFGTRHQSVVDFKHDLMSLGFGTHWSNPTTYFGPDTEKVVREFQRYYGLSVNGRGDQATLNKINEVLSSPLQLGARSSEVQSFKQDLMKAGFGTHWSNPTTYYGSDTERVVREFQNANGLAVSGIAEEVTLRKVKELQPVSLELGTRHESVVDFKHDLMSLGFGTHWSNPTTYFGSDTEKVVREFQNYYGLSVNGRGDQATLNKINEVLSSPLQRGARSNEVLSVKEDLVKAGYGTHWSNPTNYFGADTEKVVREFQSTNSLAVNGIIDEVTRAKIVELASEVSSYGTVTATSLNVRSGPGTSHSTIGSLPNGTQVEILNRESNGWIKISFNNSVGYVSGQFIEETSQPTYKTGYVTATSLNVRSGPGTSYGTIGSLPNGSTVEIRNTEGNGWHQISFNNSVGYVSGQFIEMGNPPSGNGSLRGKVIMLDAGHGGSDSGAIANGMLEKALVLDITLRAKQLLERQGATVLMTRSTDVYLTLAQRSSLANSSNADIFISIHANAFNGIANGTETFWHGKYQRSNSIRLANSLQDAVVRKMGTNYRRVAEGNYHVIRETRIPSALLEVGFMDHSGDAAKLNQSSYRQRAAEGILEGVQNYFR
ncbi:peptidoglycan-binding protein [Evansella clarkii]|uniref:peptidoglycan-binding protein n=1 Tax=Evansella clarkii TaxID=79879 RepID=UPI000997DC09|nr:peptidoglycan-binding protein [Evansella clarkii]